MFFVQEAWVPSSPPTQVTPATLHRPQQGGGGLEAKIQEAYSLEGGDDHIQYSVVGVYGVQTGSQGVR